MSLTPKVVDIVVATPIWTKNSLGGKLTLYKMVWQIFKVLSNIYSFKIQLEEHWSFRMRYYMFL